MRYNEIFNEENNVSEVKNKLFNVFKEIKVNCSEIINEFYLKTDHLLLRGINGINNDITLLQSSNNRIPSDTPIIIQELIDKLLLKYHFDALRSNSYFCTCEYVTAHQYGNVYVIFPVNGYSYTWFKHAEDVYDDLISFYEKFFELLKQHISPEEYENIDEYGYEENFKEYYLKYPEIVQEAMEYYIDEISPTSSNIINATDDHEIMFTGKYYCIKYDLLKSTFDDMIDDVITDILLSDTDDEILEILNKYLIN